MDGAKIPYKMLSLDAFSKWLGIEILECEMGRCKVERLQRSGDENNKVMTMCSI